MKPKPSIHLPKIIAGTSSLGNLYQALADDVKLAIVKSVVDHSEGLPVFDTAGKYGAGLALESLGKSLKIFDVAPDQVMISNKLGWLRMPLKTDEPTFEMGVWKDLKYDAYQDISYDGILKCYEQGIELLNGYETQLLSIHDPDEYLKAASSESDKEKRFNDILEGYKALAYLKEQGKTKAIGIGSKDWTIIHKIASEVKLDWVMFANSITVYSHPAELLFFIKDLKNKGIQIINSAVFNGGFLTGSDYFNYQLMNRTADASLYEWRDTFYKLCNDFALQPASVCVYFALHIPGVNSIALNSSSEERTASNMKMADIEIPKEFWKAMKNKGLIASDYPHL